MYNEKGGTETVESTVCVTVTLLWTMRTERARRSFSCYTPYIYHTWYSTPSVKCFSPKRLRRLHNIACGLRGSVPGDEARLICTLGLPLWAWETYLGHISYVVSVTKLKLSYHIWMDISYMEVQPRHDDTTPMCARGKVHALVS